MDKLNNGFYEYIQLFKKYKDATDGYKNVVLYGWRWSNGGGTYLEWIFNKYYGIKFDYVIDDYEVSYAKKIYRKNLLEYLNPAETVILASVDVGNIVGTYGYQIGRNYFFINGDMGVDNIGYYEYLEKKCDINLIDRNTKIKIKDVCKDGSDYAVSRGIGMPLLCEYISKKYPDQKILDIGCGKGAAMILLREFGYSKVDGLEYLEELCHVAETNLGKCGLSDSTVFCGDATVFEHYDDYNMFYLYDPFQGETLKKTVKRINDSFYLRPRKIVMVYANPWCHQIITGNSDFKLINQIDGDWFTRMSNIYEIG